MVSLDTLSTVFLLFCSIQVICITFLVFIEKLLLENVRITWLFISVYFDSTSQDETQIHGKKGVLYGELVEILIGQF